jgi:fatty acid desaturase
MQQPEWIQKGIVAGNQFHFQTKNSVLHNMINCCFFGLLLVGIGSIFSLSRVFPLALYIPFAGIALGLIFFSLFILVVHEASHRMFMICKGRNRSLFWNRLFGWTVSIPFGIHYVKHWEEGHHAHHLHPIEPTDPQNCPERTTTGKGLLKWIARVLLIPGGSGLAEYYCPTARKYAFNWKILLSQALFWLLFGIVSMVYLHWSVIVAAILGLKVAQILNQIKISMEHGGEIGQRENPFLRSCSSFFPLRRILMPFNISYHFEHHLNYCVPWYDLKKYHRELRKVIPQEWQHRIWHNNREVWAQLVGQVQ